MPVAISCPHCRHGISLPDHLRGQKVRCAKCRQVFVATASAKSSSPARGKSGVSHVTLFLGMIIAFLLAVVVVGGAAFWFMMQPGPQTASTPIAAVTKETPPPAPTTPATKKVDEPTPLAKLEPAPKEKEPTPAPASGDGSLTPEILQRVKRSTVYLRVSLVEGGVSQGTGFVGVEPGTIITNAHVLQMMRPLSPAPKQIEVILNSGQADERTVPGQLVGLDRAADLAILKLNADNLPPPLPVLTAQDVFETQQVFVCGFPLGQRLGKEITIGNSRVASLRRDNGVLTRIQLSGEMNPGNSGGPIIDTRGNVVGVAVSGVASTTINFAIPGENVHALLNGRLDKVTLNHPYIEGKQVKLPAKVRMLDPLKRVRKVAIEVWTGDAGEPRPSSGTAREAVPQRFAASDRGPQLSGWHGQRRRAAADPAGWQGLLVPGRLFGRRTVPLVASQRLASRRAARTARPSPCRPRTRSATNTWN